MMRVAIRTDASVHIGTGHVMRCLALADALRSRGVDVTFVCRELEGNLCDLILARQFSVRRLPPDGHAPGVDWQGDAQQTIAAVADLPPLEWLIVDHYRLDRKWENLMRAVTQKILVIDDIADREHDCDLLVDQNLSDGMAQRYNGLVPVHTSMLLGPDYALLRPEFLAARATLGKRGGALRRLLFFFGGSDPGNETARALEGLRQLQRPGLAVDVVVGATNPHRHQIMNLCTALPNTTLHCQVDNMAKLMAAADLAIGAGGVTTWERCCLGLPSLVAILADNQLELTLAVSKYGAIVNLGWADSLSPADYLHAIESVTPAQLAGMEQLGLALVDGMGSARVADTLVP